MNVELDLNKIEDYHTFLKIKAIPIHRFTGREAWFPDEYSHLVGKSFQPPELVYQPKPWLFDYQRDISRMAIKKQKFAAFMRCGRGKTNVAFEFARHILGEIRRNQAILMVSPSMVVNQTIQEANRFYGGELPIERVRANQLQQWINSGTGQFGITNYESLTEDIVNSGRIVALIADESSIMKSSYGAWGQRLIELGRGLPWKLCLTGTPAPNDRIEYANHAVFLDQFPTVNAFLAKFFVNRGQTQERWEMKPHAVKPFYRSLAHWSIFLSDPSVYGWKDNCEPLPPINTHIIDVPMTDEQEQAIRDAGGGMFGEMPKGGIGSRGVWSRIGKGIAKGGKRIASNKPQIVCDLTKGDGGSLVWTKYNEEQDMLARMMPDAESMSGDTPEDERIKMLARFKSGESQTMITKDAILGFGQNLQVARRQVFSTIEDSWEKYHQCVMRSNRTGSKFPLDVYIPVTEVERPMLETVLTKAHRIEEDVKEQEALFREVSEIK